jgi:hypothetical protein
MYFNSRPPAVSLSVPAAAADVLPVPAAAADVSPEEAGAVPALSARSEESAGSAGFSDTAGPSAVPDSAGAAGVSEAAEALAFGAPPHPARHPAVRIIQQISAAGTRTSIPFFFRGFPVLYSLFPVFFVFTNALLYRSQSFPATDSLYVECRSLYTGEGFIICEVKDYIYRRGISMSALARRAVRNSASVLFWWSV